VCVVAPVAQDKAPASLNEVDLLMDETFQALSSTSTKLEAAQVRIVLVLLLKMRYMKRW
jgi:hypothetical protein